MKQCEECGAVLPEKDSSRCRACGAIQSPVAHAPSVYISARRKEAHQRGKPQSKAVRVLSVVALCMAVILIAASATTYFLYNTFNSEKAYDALGAALLKGDTAALQALVVGKDIAVTPAGLAALCKAFSTQENVDRLLDQLNTQSASDAAVVAGESLYPALAPAADNVFLGYASYKLEVRPVTLRIPAVAQGLLLSVDGIPVSGQVTAEGVEYPGFFPGIYLCQVSGQTALGETVTSPQTEVSLFNSSAAVLFDGALPIGDITVKNCLSDEASITVNGTAVAQKSIGGVVALPQVSVGSTIAMTYTAPYGATTTASVVYADKATTELSFEGHVTEGGVPTEDEFKTTLGAFFSSYLDACNNGDAARIATCTEMLRSLMTESVTSTNSKNNVSVYTGVKTDLESVTQHTYENLPSLIFNAKFTYTSTHRTTHKEETKSALYTLEMVYSEGWKVNRIATLSQTDFESGAYSTLPA